jgi:hypothetical protein
LLIYHKQESIFMKKKLKIYRQCQNKQNKINMNKNVVHNITFHQMYIPSSLICPPQLSPPKKKKKNLKLNWQA